MFQKKLLDQLSTLIFPGEQYIVRTALNQAEPAVWNLLCHPAGVGSLDEVAGSGEQQDRGLDGLQALCGEIRGIGEERIELYFFCELLSEWNIRKHFLCQTEGTASCLGAKTNWKTQPMGQGVAACGDDGQCPFRKAAGKLQGNVCAIAEPEQDSFRNAEVVEQGSGIAGHVVDGEKLRIAGRGIGVRRGRTTVGSMV